MTSAISTSVLGVQSATQKLNVAAEEIVTSGLSFSGVTDLESKQITRNSKSGGPVRSTEMAVNEKSRVLSYMRATL